MKLKKVENYDAGYSRTDLLKKGALILATTSLICGCATSCNNEVMGDMVYNHDDYDGGQVCVSDCDVSSEDESETELILGDMVCVSESSED